MWIAFFIGLFLSLFGIGFLKSLIFDKHISVNCEDKVTPDQKVKLPMIVWILMFFTVFIPVGNIIFGIILIIACFIMYYDGDYVNVRIETTNIVGKIMNKLLKQI